MRQRPHRVIKGFICFLCDADFLKTLKPKRGHRYFIVCSQDNIAETVNVFPTPKPKNVNIQPLDSLSLTVLGKIVHRGYNWLIENQVAEESIVTIVVPTDDMAYLMGIFTSGFLRIPVIVKVISRRKTSRLSIVEDFSPAELDLAIRSFNEEDYLHARFVFSGIERRSTSIENKHIFSTLTKLCDFYTNWDDFNYLAARGILGQIYIELESLEKQIKHFANIRVSLQENEKSLDRLNRVFLSAGKKNESVIQTPDFLHLLLDIFLRGKRLQKLGRYHDACIRYYRVLEGVVQHRLLKQYGFDVKKPEFDVLCRKIGLTKDELCKNLEMGTLPSQIAFNEGFLVLKSCCDDFVKRIDTKMVQSLQHARNNSLLVHGTNPLKKETVEKLGAFTEQILGELFTVSGLNFDVYCRQCMPCTLSMSILTP